MLTLKTVAAGYNGYGQLGLGISDYRGYHGEMVEFLPAVSLGTGLTATAIASGYRHTCALLSNGQLKCWGVSRILLPLASPRCQYTPVTSLIGFALFEQR